jgi:hypothetical protein
MEYRWNFGDDSTPMTTDNPGREWKRENNDTNVTQDVEKNYEITHRYQQLGTFDTTLTIVFNGQYSVNGGPWVDIAGSLTATSAPHSLRVREARGELILPPGNN